MASGKVEKQARDQAVTDVVEEQQGRLLRLIRRTLRDRDEAEDVLQDVLENYIEAYDVGAVVNSLGAWLATVATNKVLDRFRKKKNQTAYETALALEEPAPHDQPDDDFERQRLRLFLTEAIEALPKEQREVFIQNELEGKTFEEMAQETGVSINTLLARKRYAIKFLRTYLKEIHDDYE